MATIFFCYYAIVKLDRALYNLLFEVGNVAGIDTRMKTLSYDIFRVTIEDRGPC